MIDSVEKYLDLLADELGEVDAATRQDALTDAEDHLRAALWEACADKPESTEADLLPGIIEVYGGPEETAEAYLDLEERYPAGITAPLSRHRGHERGRSGFFGIYRDARAWGALLYSLLSLITGVVYFTWTVTGVSISVSLLILIVGIPIAMGFFFSFHGLAFLEGRIVEALLGVRMPRRQKFFKQNMTWGEKIKRILLRPDSWLIVLYQILMLPLGIIYFTLAVTLIAVSVSFIGSPIVYLVFLFNGMISEIDLWLIPEWSLPMFAVLGIFLLTASLHLFRAIGRFHGRLAKGMLVPGARTV